MNLSLNKVTPLSKALAMLLFIALPFVGFWLGVEHKNDKLENLNIKSTTKDINLTSMSGSSSSHKDDSAYEYSLNCEETCEVIRKTKGYDYETSILTFAIPENWKSEISGSELELNGEGLVYQMYADNNPFKKDLEITINLSEESIIRSTEFYQLVDWIGHLSSIQYFPYDQDDIDPENRYKLAELSLDGKFTEFQDDTRFRYLEGNLTHNDHRFFYVKKSCGEMGCQGYYLISTDDINSSFPNKFLPIMISDNSETVIDIISSFDFINSFARP
jgi:hypothetical protein